MTGLKPATWYHYRFSYDGARSRVGRTRTAPGRRATPDHLRFGVVSCANWQAGWFSVYRHLAQRDDLHAVLHLGDYLYEYAPGRVRLRPVERGHPAARPGARDGLDRRLPAPARAVQVRPGPAGPAREVPVDHHVGRPRGHQRPVAQRRREPPAGRGRLQEAAGPRPPRLRRVDAAADGRHRRPARRHPAVPPALASASWPRSRCSTCAPTATSRSSPPLPRRRSRPARSATPSARSSARSSCAGCATR